jgi:putative transposase
MGLETVYPKPNLSRANKEHIIFPYLLRGVTINRVNQVWSTDITYIRLKQGFVYLVAIIDWYSRYVLDWEISTTLEADFCIEALTRALARGCCDIFNTDQGSQFTSHSFTGLLSANGISISMDGKGRALDNIFVERLWRSLKYEMVYLMELTTVSETRQEIGGYFNFYNNERPHQSLGYKTPSEIYFL